MRKLIFALVGVVLFITTSCVTTARTYDYDYRPYNEAENVVVMGETCYVYYKQPTTLFLNSLHVIDGSYYYWHSNRYIPVIFPNWSVWSPHRYFYYDRNKWLWKDRYRYNHNQYRNTHKWNDYRKPQYRPNTNYNRHPNNHNYNTNRRPNTRPSVFPRNNGSRGGRR